MERAGGFANDDDAEAKLDKLEALASPAASLEDVALLAELLSLPTVRYPASTASPQRKKEQTFTALLRQLEALARSRPALMLFEVLTFRPEFQAPWTGLSHVPSLTLSRLDPLNGAAMVSFIGKAATIGFRFGTDGFVIDFGPEGVRPRRADPGGCALTVAATPTSLASLVYGGRRVADAEAEGELTLTGYRRLFDRFLTWFPLPEKIG